MRICSVTSEEAAAVNERAAALYVNNSYEEGLLLQVKEKGILHFL